jgi:hypothetical protein
MGELMTGAVSMAGNLAALCVLIISSTFHQQPDNHMVGVCSCAATLTVAELSTEDFKALYDNQMITDRISTMNRSKVLKCIDIAKGK